MGPMQENAVLIYGPRKAGTTLLQRLIDGSSLYVYPTELKIKQLSAGWSNQAQFVEECHRTNRLRQQTVDGFDHEKFEKDTIETMPQARCLREAVLLMVQAAIDSSPEGEWVGWVAKEVGGDFNVILNDWKKMFPGSRVVVIVRNPFYVARSIFRERRRRNKQLRIREIVHQIIQPWLVLKTVARHVDRDDVHLVYYEDVVLDVEAQMRSVAQFLGVEFHHKLTGPTLFGRPTVVRTSALPQTAVFRDRKPYWNGLSFREAALLTLIGSGCGLLCLTWGLISFSNGRMRLAKPMPSHSPS